MVYVFENFELDKADFCLRSGGRRVPLEPKSLRVLLELVEHPGTLLQKSALLEAVWPGTFVEETTLTRAVALLRRQLGDSSRAPRFIETVPTLGYRFLPEVTVRQRAAAPEGSAGGAAAVVEELAAAVPAEVLVETVPGAVGVGAGRRRLWVAAAVVMVLLGVAGGVLAWHRWAGRAMPIRSLAVLPFENLSGQADQEYFASGLTDQITTELAAVPGLRVVSRTSSAQEQGRRASLAQMERDLQVDAILEGSVLASGGTVRLNTRLVDTRSDRTVWTHSFAEPVEDAILLQGRVTREIAAATRGLLPEQAGDARGEPRAPVPGAYDAYLRGLYLWQRRMAAPSVRYFALAVALDPQYADAYAGLAGALESEVEAGSASWDEVVPQARAAAEHAIALDANCGVAWTVLGSLEDEYGWDWEKAGQELRRGIALAPNSSVAELKYAIHLDAMGQAEAAIAHMRRAVALDPLSFWANRHLGSVLYYARRYDEALAALRIAGEMEPSKQDFLVANWMSWVYAKQGLQQEAVQADLLTVAAEEGGAAGQLRAGRLQSVYAAKGWPAYWRARAAASRGEGNGCAAFQAGRWEALAGRPGVAIRDLQQSVAGRCLWLGSLTVDPVFDEVRKQPGYAALHARIFGR